LILCGIYKITSPSGKVYIGYSKNIIKRFREYKSLDQKIIGQPYIYRSLKKYGVTAHRFEIKELCDFDDLCKRERYWQDHYDVTGEMGLNCHLTETDEKPRVVSQETRDKLSKANKGKTVSESAKLKISKANKGRTHTDETRKKFSDAKIGKTSPRKGAKLSDDTKTKISQANKGNVPPNKGIPHTQETKTKISKANTGYKMSDDWCIRNGLKSKGNTNTRIGVSQYDLLGNHIQDFVSILHAEQNTGIYQKTIVRVASGITKNPQKFIWKYTKYIK